MTYKPINILAGLTAAITLSGCTIYTPVADFTKQRYTNSIAYFNTFYNAQRLFSDAEDEVIKSRRDFLEQSGGVKVFTIPASARQKFQSSIEKNSKILTFYPDSKWVDDALLMIGKAYFYMEDDVRAERKFSELAVQFPQSDLILESRLWLGKSLLRQKKVEQGLKQLDDLFTSTLESDEDLAGLAANEMAQHYYGLNDFVLAEKYYSLAAVIVDDNELKAQIYFQIGKCYLELRLYEKARQAFATAADVSPVYTLLFQAQLQLNKSKSYQGDYDAAMDGLNDMLRDSKNTEFFGILHFEIANILNLQGMKSEAVQKYRYVDTAFARTDVAARSYYALGKYYEETELNYDSTRVLYNKAKVEFPSSEITKVAAAKAEIFNKYHDLLKDLRRLDSLHGNAELVRSQIDFLFSAAADSSERKDTLTVQNDLPPKKMTKPGIAEAKKDSVPAFDSTRIKDRNNRERIQNTLIDSLQRSIIRTKFELGGLFFLEIQQADSALYWFNDVVTNYPDNEFVPRSLYTIAEINRTVKQRPKNELDSIYTIIVKNFPLSPYANEARKSLGLPIIETQKDSAKELFEQAEALAESNKFIPAIQAYKRISERFSSSPVSPKALYSAGWHYEYSVINNDSANAIYKRLVVAYPASQFATIVRPKITEYENEIKRVEQEKQKEIDAQKLKEQQEKELKAKQEEKLHAPDGQKAQPTESDTLAKPKLFKL